ncbi:MAG: AMP-dependent synthetase [Polyangiaceae bacterium]|nr:AMP-dependent synthetase [Polyangiaceae bacterium]
MDDNRHLRALDRAYLSEIIDLHHDPEHGAPYWIRRADDLGVDPARDVRSFDDFRRLFAFKGRQEQARYEQDLRELPVEEFIPRAALRRARWLWASETGGTTGIAKRGTWGDRYWDHILAFSDELLDLHGVPRDESWLFIGPTGPHTTGRLMISIGERRGGRVFCIDIDPRIVRIYLQEGDERATERYIRHIWEQVEPILRYQRVGVLFCTATLLELLPRYVDVAHLGKIKAVVHAGLAMSRDTHRYLRERLFAGRPVVGIYGTSVSGISYQKPYEPEDDHRIIYIPSQPCIVLEAVDAAGAPVRYGQDGDVRCFRFTEDQLIPGFIERDRGTRVRPFGKFAARYPWDWLGDPHSPSSLSGQPIEGVY